MSPGGPSPLERASEILVTGNTVLRSVNLQAAVDGVDLDGGEVGGGCGVGCVAQEDDGGKPVALDIQIQTPTRPEGALFIEVGGSEFWDGGVFRAAGSGFANAHERTESRIAGDGCLHGQCGEARHGFGVVCGIQGDQLDAVVGRGGVFSDEAQGDVFVLGTGSLSGLCELIDNQGRGLRETAIIQHAVESRNGGGHQEADDGDHH